MNLLRHRCCSYFYLYFSDLCCDCYYFEIPEQRFLSSAWDSNMALLGIFSIEIELCHKIPGVSEQGKEIEKRNQLVGDLKYKNRNKIP